MGLFIILAVILIVGIILLVKGALDYDGEVLMGTGSFLGLILTIFSGILIIVTGIFAIRVKVTADNEYDKFNYQKIVLEQRLKVSDKVGNELLYKDIVEWNNELRDCKAWRNNFFVNVFYNEKIAKMDYIEINFDKN